MDWQMPLSHLVGLVGLAILIVSVIRVGDMLLGAVQELRGQGATLQDIASSVRLVKSAVSSLQESLEASIDTTTESLFALNWCRPELLCNVKNLVKRGGSLTIEAYHTRWHSSDLVGDIELSSDVAEPTAVQCRIKLSQKAAEGMQDSPLLQGCTTDEPNTARRTLDLSTPEKLDEVTSWITDIFRHLGGCSDESPVEIKLTSGRIWPVAIVTKVA